MVAVGCAALAGLALLEAAGLAGVLTLATLRPAGAGRHRGVPRRWEWLR